MKFGIEIFSEGYKSAIRIYQNGKDVSDLYRDEIQYVNQRIAMVVSRYREMYRYQIMMSSTYGGGYIVEFDANQIRDIGFDGIDLVYSDLDSLSIQFSEELNGVLDNVVKAYEFSRECNDVCGVKSQYVGNEDKRYWEELLDTVVKYTTDVLERFYVYYVGLLTNRDVIEYMLHRYDRGLVIGRYHNELANSILHMRIDISLYQIQDVEVDIAHTYWIDVGDEYVGGYRVIWDSIMKNAYYLPLVTKGSAKGLCDVLEMIGYVNDAVIRYYVSNGISLYRGYVLVSQVLGNLQLGAGSYTCMADSFTDVIGSIELGDYFEYQGCVFSYDDNLESVEMYIPIREFNTKVMASRIFDVGKLMRSYVNMVEEYSKGIYSIS
jgi:hypothetical protein|nr:MAG TPA: hypothetical protein [Herelleviridae sp.]